MRDWLTGNIVKCVLPAGQVHRHRPPLVEAPLSSLKRPDLSSLSPPRARPVTNILSSEGRRGDEGKMHSSWYKGGARVSPLPAGR